MDNKDGTVDWGLEHWDEKVGLSLLAQWTIGSHPRCLSVGVT